MNFYWKTAMSKLRGRIWIVIILCHLSLVAMGTAYVEFYSFPVIGSFLDMYSEASGAGDGYGFFAPGIYGQPDAYFEILDQNNKIQKYRLDSGRSHEYELRVGSIFSQFQADFDDVEKLRRSLSASLASTIFSKNPNARAVTIYLDEFNPVTMSEYRAGLRPHWNLQYMAKYEYHAKKVRAQ